MPLDSPTTPITALTLDDLREAWALQRAGATDLPTGYLQPRDRNQFRGFFDGSAGLALGIREGGALLALGLLRLPDARAFPGSPPFPRVPAADWPTRAAFVENTVVLPAARGRGYQRALFEARAHGALACGRRWLCGAAHLENRVSWSNLLLTGFKLVGLRQDRGYPLLGLLRPLGATTLDLGAVARLVPADDCAAHVTALADGLIGDALDGNRVAYRAAPAMV